MRKIILWSVVGLFASVFVFDGWKIVETGNVGVSKTLGTISEEEKTSGFMLKLPLITSIDEFIGKEIAVDLNNLTPKAADNLSLRDMDVTVFYSVVSSNISDMRTKYANSHEIDGESGYYMPAYGLVFREARSASYKAIAKVDSLQMHKERESIAIAIKEDLQKALDKDDNGVFVVSRVVIRSVLTDASIEESIRDAVANTKKLEAKAVKVEIAKKDAEIKIEEAKGIATANNIIDKSLTKEYLQWNIYQDPNYL